MKIKLYKPFEHWQDKGPIWILSDPHFDDEDCKLMDPNWPTPEEQAKLINSKVGKHDTLIILGDIGNIEWVKKLKGYKVLVMGNHDKGASNYKRVKNLKSTVDMCNKMYETFDVKEENRQKLELDNHLFDEVYEGPLFISDKILLSHEPVKLPFGINVHGHDHAGVGRITYSNETTLFNVASNVIGYAPVRLDKLIEGAGCTDIHRIAIDRQIKNKGKK